MNSADNINRTFLKLRDCGAQLNSIVAITEFLERAVGLCGMTLLNITVVPVYGNEPHLKDEGGVTGVAVITESHCAVHTWPEERAVNVDMYSCKPFDAKVLQAHAEAFFLGKVVK